MAPLACVDLSPLELHLLLRDRPAWRSAPVAVVSELTPRGRIRWVNRAARRRGVIPGQRYGEVAGRLPALRAGVVGAAEVARAQAALIRLLRRFTPLVEAEASGTFWLGAGGITPLYPSLTAWGEAIATTLGRAGLEAAVAIGHTRLATLAAARTRPGLTLLPTPAAERQAVATLPLTRLGLPPAAVHRLATLGVTTAGHLARLPAAGVAERFGPELARLHRLAREEEAAPLQPTPEVEAVAATTTFDAPVSTGPRLVAAVARLLGPLLDRLAARDEAAARLHLRLGLDTGEGLLHHLCPARPTREEAPLVELVRLRLEGERLAGGVVEVGVGLEGVAGEATQTTLLPPHPHRDRAAAVAALARITAEFGEGVVGRFILCDAHLPEAGFSHLPLEGLPAPRPPAAARRLVRRIAPHPTAIAPPPAHRLVAGPVCLTTGWWVGPEVRRDYWLARGPGRALLWLYHDRRTGRWLCQGMVG